MAAHSERRAPATDPARGRSGPHRPLRPPLGGHERPWPDAGNAPVATAIGTLAQANAEATAIVLHPRTWQTLLGLKELSSGSNKPLLVDSAGAPTSGVRRSIYGVPVYLTSQLSTTETQRSSSDCSSAYVYQASEIIAVRRSDTIVEFDSSRLFNTDQSELRAISRWDVVVPNPSAIVRIAGIRAQSNNIRGAEDDLSTDHVVPLIAGGDPWDSAGLRVLCPRCNSAKATRDKAMGMGMQPGMGGPSL